MQLILTVLTIVLAWIGAFMWKIARKHFVLTHQFPGPQSISWIAGNLHETTSPDRHKAILKWAKEFGGLYYIRLVNWPVLVVTDPPVVAEVLHSRHLDKPVKEVYSQAAELMSPYGHPDLVTGLTDNYWKVFRKGCAPAFSPNNIRAGFKHSARAGDQLIEALQKLGQGAVVDIDHACMCETLDVIGLFGFNHDFGATRTFGTGAMSHMMRVLIKAEAEVQRRAQNPLRKYTALLTAEGRRSRESYTAYHAIMRQLLDEVKARAPPPAEDQTIGAYMMRLQDPVTGGPMADERIMPHIGMFFFAGHDTTGHTMSWTLFLLSQHPEVEAKVAAELDAAELLATPQRPQPRSIIYDDLGQLPYLTAAIKEAMRIYPAVAVGTLRTCRSDFLLAGRYTIPADTLLWVPIHALHNSPLVWERADEYLPERWFEKGMEYAKPSPSKDDMKPVVQLHATATGKPSKGGHQFDLGFNRDYQVGMPSAEATKRYIPFSDGRRDCIGQALAKMNYTCTLAKLMSHFSFRLVEPAETVREAETMAITMQPGNGLMMRCIPRCTT